MSDVQINLMSDDRQFDAHAYTIVIKRVTLDGKPVFHGRVIELPDLEAFEPTYDEAYDFLIDGIQNSKAAFDEQGRQFPAPLPDETPEFSGRVTIRMPAWLHAQLDHGARTQETSLNQYMVTLLSWAVSAAPTWVAQAQTVGAQASFGTAGTVTFSGTTASQVQGFYTAGWQRLQNLQFELEGVGAGSDPEFSVPLTGLLAYRSAKRASR